MRILYTTDLHGDKDKYWHVFEQAKTKKVDAVVNGGDMLTLEDDLHQTQRDFIRNFLERYFGEYEKAGIFHLGFLGNDDLKIHDECFDTVCTKYPHAVNLAQKSFTLENYEFIGMNWVTDYPFRLKDRCRKDRKDYIFQRQLGSGLLSNERGFQQIPNWFSLASTLPTIEDELNALPKPKDSSHAVYVIHMPPARVCLDVCWSGERVGSEAIYSFIERMQPMLSLHGHIHESYNRGGIWKATIGKTISLQPGQAKTGTVTYAIIDLEHRTFERIEERMAES